MRIRINWDTTDDDHPNGQEVDGLPEVVNVPKSVINEEKEQEGAVADWLSDKYGWCVNGWAYI